MTTTHFLAKGKRVPACGAKTDPRAGSFAVRAYTGDVVTCATCRRSEAFRLETGSRSADGRCATCGGSDCDGCKIGSGCECGGYGCGNCRY